MTDTIQTAPAQFATVDPKTTTVSVPVLSEGTLVRHDGQTFRIVVTQTPESEDALGHSNVARVMRENNQVAAYYMTKPKGFAFYGANVWANGSVRIFKI